MKYRDAGKLPSELESPRSWRTHAGPIEDIWPQAQTWLEEARELEGLALFEWLQENNSGQLEPGHLRCPKSW